MTLRLWRDFKVAFWAGYQKAIRRNEQKQLRADAHERLRVAMTRYAVTEKEKRYMAGKES